MCNIAEFFTPIKIVNEIASIFEKSFQQLRIDTFTGFLCGAQKQAALLLTPVGGEQQTALILHQKNAFRQTSFFK